MSDPLPQNLRLIREERNLSLDKLADLTGVSKSMLRQIETGQSSPTISTLWKIANGLRVPFTALLREQNSKVVLGGFKAGQPLTEQSQGYRLFPLVSFNPDRSFEIYYIEIDPGISLEAEPHNGIPEEYVFVLQGRIDITVDGEPFTVEKESFISFLANCPHHYHNSGTETATALMLITYLS